MQKFQQFIKNKLGKAQRGKWGFPNSAGLSLVEFNVINLFYIYFNFAVTSEAIISVQFSFLLVGVWVWVLKLLILQLKVFTIKIICY